MRKLACQCLHPEAEEAARIAQERFAELQPVTMEIICRLTYVEHSHEGYILDVAADQSVTIRASQRRHFIAGTGEWLRRILEAAERDSQLEVGTWEHQPAVSERIHYMPGHFGNSFEICSTSEMRRYLDDLALSGASGYGDWFDPNDMPDPYRPHVYHSASMFLWRRKKEWYAYSQRLGLDNVLIMTPNVGYVDQMRPEWVGVRNAKLHVQGQVLCPSNPQAREVILDNQRRLFEDLQHSGIAIRSVVCVPYDDGGCACDDCQPYYPVFLQLVEDVYATIQPYYPDLQVEICGWWTSDEESKRLQDFAEGLAQGWFGGFQFSPGYGAMSLPTDLGDIFSRITVGCFLHIGYSCDNRDVYTKDGVHSALRRMQSVIRSFATARCQGFMTYNESFGDHFNAFAAGLLGWNPDRSVEEIANFYGRSMFGLQGEALAALTAVLLEMEGLDASHAANWTKVLRDIEPSVRTHKWQKWAFGQIRSKAELMRLDAEINKQLPEQTAWQAFVEEATLDENACSELLAIMDERLAETEWLWRGLYGFGVLRHILVPDRMLPAWHRVYLQLRARLDKVKLDTQGRIASGTMSEEA